MAQAQILTLTDEMAQNSQTLELQWNRNEGSREPVALPNICIGGPAPPMNIGDCFSSMVSFLCFI